MMARETFQTGLWLTTSRPVTHSVEDGRRVAITQADIDAHLDSLDAACRSGLHPSQGRKRDAHGETCGACGRRIQP
jgi:hypothetical protein